MLRADRHRPVNASLPDHDGERADVFPLQRREIGLIVAFWAIFAAVTAASRFLDPRGPGPGSSIARLWAGIALVDGAYWALLTGPLFLLASRVAGARRSSRALSFLIVVVAAFGAAILGNLVVGWVRSEVLPDLLGIQPGRGGRGPGGRGFGGRGFRGPRLVDPFVTLNNVITALAIMAAGLARHFSLRDRMRQQHAALLAADSAQLQAQLAEARLDALRRQLDPHFLFNTLNAVSSLVERDPRGVRRMIARLSDLLRHSMERSHEAEIPLERELELLQRYVDIMQVRFQGKLEVALTVDPRARGALVPNMILQPLVENAIKHGSTATGAERIAVTADVRGDDLVLAVLDDGPGPDSASRTTDDGGRAEGGVGLRNTRERLAHLYGARHAFSLRARDGGGTVAEMRIPFRAVRADGPAVAPVARNADG